MSISKQNTDTRNFIQSDSSIQLHRSGALYCDNYQMIKVTATSYEYLSRNVNAGTKDLIPTASSDRKLSLEAVSISQL